ncbi:MAG: SAM-dependent methyltransferase [Firmicutes bacterium]|nr:SAM-dependent methyltransferase [Bacillota bacterium]
MISERIEKVISLVKKCNFAADIGTDHAYTVIGLVKRGIAKKALACDISKGSCEKARQNIIQSGLSDKISVRCGDGLDVISPYETPDSIIISGMGGETTIDILKRGSLVLKSVDQLVLQPQKDIEKVREFIEKSDFFIEKEFILKEEDKFYIFISAVKGKAERPYTQAENFYGRFEECGDIFAEYINYEYAKVKNVIDNIKENSDSNPLAIQKLELFELKRKLCEETIRCL